MTRTQLKSAFVAVLSSACWLAVGPAVAGDAAAGKTKASVCAACHGMNGVSSNPEWPNLAGQHEAYLIKQLKAFKAGQRSDPNMTAFAATLTEDDMADLAAFFSSQPCK